MSYIGEITCPHCGLKGQALLPPASSLVIGPCPRCKEIVVIFCGKALALDREIMTRGAPLERRQHLMTVLTTFLEERMDELMPRLGTLTDEDFVGADPDASDASAFDEDDSDYIPEAGVESAASEGQFNGSAVVNQITEAEVERFVSNELPLIDDRDYFRTFLN